MDVRLNMLGGRSAYTEVGLLPGTNRSSAAFTAQVKPANRAASKVGNAQVTKVKTAKHWFKD